MKFDPAAAVTLIPDGEYDAEIVSAEETKSKKGNDMWKLAVKVWTGGGGPRVIFDYIVNPGTIYKLKQLASALGKRDLFDSGDMGTQEVTGESVRVSIKTETDKTGQFEDKNVVARYLPQSAGVTHSQNGTASKGGVDDEEIPF